jgi:hypothetical protein
LGLLYSTDEIAKLPLAESRHPAMPLYQALCMLKRPDLRLCEELLHGWSIDKPHVVRQQPLYCLLQALQKS